MTPRPPNQQRCVTCSMMIVDDNDIATCDGETIPLYAYRWIEIHGCASHSSSPAAAPVPEHEQPITWEMMEEYGRRTAEKAGREARASALDALEKLPRQGKLEYGWDFVYAESLDNLIRRYRGKK